MTAKNLNTQTEEEFQNLMPISGTVDTFFGGFELDIAFAGRSWLSADNGEEVPVVALSAGYVREPRSREIR